MTKRNSKVLEVKVKFDDVLTLVRENLVSQNFGNLYSARQFE